MLAHVRSLALIFCFVSAAQAECAPPTGLVARWSGDRTTVAQAGGVEAIPINGAGFAAGRVHDGFWFDGLDDFVQLPNQPALEPATVTVSFWMRGSLSPLFWQFLLAKGASGCSYGSYSINTAGTGGALVFDVRSGNRFVRSPYSTTLVFDGTSHHVAGTYDGATVRLYVDGVEQGVGTSASGAINYRLPNGNDLLLGRFGGTCPTPLSFAGVIDELAIFDRALSAAEVGALVSGCR